MLKIERFARIEEELKKKGSLEIPSLSQMLGCSEETVRRDLRELESVGKLNRIRGGAYLSDKYDKTYASPLRKTLYQQEKSQMSQKAMEFIHDRDVLFLDSSTTCLTLAGLLLNSKLSLTIVTNSMMICSLCTEPNSHINLICLGGSLRARTLSFVGYHTTDILSTYYADCAFISSPKATLSEGLSDNYLNEARVRESMLKHARRRFLIMDHTKFDESTNIRFNGLELVDTIITDAPLSAEWAAFCQAHSINVVI